MTDRLTHGRIDIVPGWIYRALIRNKVTVYQFNDFNIISKYLTDEDLADWVSAGMQMKGAIGLCGPSWAYAEPTEKFANIIRLGEAPGRVASVSERLTGANPLGEFEYKFVSTTDAVLLILNEGFLARFEDLKFQMTFLKAFLKELYVQMPLSDVSQTAAYSLYLKRLEQEQLTA